MSLRFVGIGFPKCGTTFLYNKLTKHPKIRKSQKERHYFSEPFHSFSSKEYREYLGKFEGDACYGEFSPGILYYPLNIKFLVDAVDSETKFVAIIRNPIDRAHSHFNQLKQVRTEIIDPSDREHFLKFSAYPEALYSGLYYFAFRQLFKYITKERIIIIQYEQLLRYFHRELNEIFEFLDLPTLNSIRDDTRVPTEYPEFREELRDFYEIDVNNLFEHYDKINNYSSISRKYWEDFV